MKNLTETYCAYIEAKDAIDQIIDSAEFRAEVTEYADFVLSDEVGMHLNPRDRYEIGLLRSHSFDLSRWRDPAGIALEFDLHDDDARMVIPLAWFTDRDADRAQVLANAAEKKAQDLRDVAAEEEAAKEARRAQFEVLSVEFGDKPASP